MNVTVKAASTDSNLGTFINETLRAAGKNEETLGHAIVHFLPHVIDADRILVYRFLPGAKRLVVAYETPPTVGATLLGTTQAFEKLPPFMANALRWGRQACIEDLERFPLLSVHRKAPRFERVAATICSPFSVNDAPGGLIVVDYFSRPKSIESRTQKALSLIANMFGETVGRSRPRDVIEPATMTVERAGAQMAVLANLSEALSRKETSGAMLDAARSGIDGLFEGGASKFILGDGGKDLAAREAIDGGEPVIASDDGRTRIVLPLASDGETVGVIELRTNSHTIPIDQLRFLRTVANLVASSAIAERRFEQVQREATTDGLTGLANHRNMMERYTRLFAEAKASERPLALMMIDIDKLRDVNNAYGHLVGDAVLRYVGSALAKHPPQNAVVARYGGEEFAIVLPDHSVDSALALGRELVDRIADETPSDLPRTTVSIGIAGFPAHAKQADRLLENADKALYVAKYGGRNRVYVAHKTLNAEWEKLAMDAFFTVVTSRSFMTGPQAIDHVAERVAIAGNRNIDMALALAQAVDVRDKYTSGHSHAVSNYALKLARQLGFTGNDLEEVRLGALLHDIGKIGTPEYILGKDGPLTDAEFEIMRRHPADGAKILAPIPSMQRVSISVETHQEYWNGSGYPKKLKGEQIPRISRIISIADAYHAMVSTRPYRKGMPIDVACGILTNGAGKQWDPTLVDVFVRAIT